MAYLNPNLGINPATGLPYTLAEEMARHNGALRGPAVPQIGAITPNVPKSMRKRNLLDALFGMGGDSAGDLGGLLGQDAVGGARTQGLLNAGLALLAAGGRQPNVTRPNLGQALAGALQAGQGGYQAALESAGALRQMQAQQQEAQMAAARQAAIERLQGEYANGPQTPERAAEFAAKLSMLQGNAGAAGTAAGVMANLKPKPESQPWKEVDRGDVIELRHPVTGQVIDTVKKGAAPRAPGSGGPSFAQQMMLERFLAGRDDRITAGFDKDVAPDLEIINRYDQLAEAAKQFGASGPVQVGTLFSFITQLDDTAVRDGERELVTKAASLKDQMAAIRKRLADGEQVAVPPAMYQSIMEFLKLGRKRAAERANQKRDKWLTRAQRYPGMMDPEELTVLPGSVLWSDVEGIRGGEENPYR